MRSSTYGALAMVPSPAQVLTHTLMLRREKKDSLKQLPPKTRAKLLVEVSVEPDTCAVHAYLRVRLILVSWHAPSGPSFWSAYLLSTNGLR